MIYQFITPTSIFSCCEVHYDKENNRVYAKAQSETYTFNDVSETDWDRIHNSLAISKECWVIEDGGVRTFNSPNGPRAKRYKDKTLRSGV